MNDGDTAFALATGEVEIPDVAVMNTVLAAAADAVTLAIVRAVRAAQGHDGPGGRFPSYRDLYVPPTG